MGIFDWIRSPNHSIETIDKKEIKETRSIHSISPEFHQILKDAKSLKTDLVEMTEHHPTCAECAKYQGRVFSISGKDKRFPKLPESVLQSGEIHEGCRHSFFPFIYGVSYSAYGHKNIMKFSNRPFVDDRNQEEKEEWERQENERLAQEKDRKDFDWVKKNLSDMAPKSFGGYRKIKSSHSANFQKLAAAAKEKGYTI